jgi:hypothetical protein
MFEYQACGQALNLYKPHIYYMFLFVYKLQHLCCALREGRRLASKNRCVAQQFTEWPETHYRAE